MFIHFVGDGERDAATIPHLVQNILGVEVEPKSYKWRDLHLRSGKGYAKRLRFAVLRAIDDGAAGLVAVVDRDNAPARSRLRELQQDREDHRANGPAFPTALGEAGPHGEAWLLDDPYAIREALELDEDVLIPNVRKSDSPKSSLDALIDGSRRREEKRITILAEIAQRVRLSRCTHHTETGFGALVEDVRREFAVFIPKAKEK
jgi:hypothetical protein